MAATDERAIHEFPTGTIDDNSLLIMDRPTSTPGEYETEKFAIANLGLKLLGGIDFPSNLDTDDQDIFGAINEVNTKAMNTAAEYDETASYSKGDYCIYQNATYRCIKATGTTTGTFVTADWTLVKVLDEIKTNTDTINELNSSIGADAWNSSTSYTVGSYCIHDNTLWKCTTANSNQEPASGSTYWDDTSIADELADLHTTDDGEIAWLQQLSNMLSGYKFETINLEGSGASVSFNYAYACIVIIGRGASGIYYGHWSGYEGIVNAQNHTAAFTTGTGSTPYKLTITNSGAVTDRLTVIYR